MKSGFHNIKFVVFVKNSYVNRAIDNIGFNLSFQEKTMKILIADDDKTVHAAYTKFLEKSGHEVLHAYDGKEALTTAQEELPNIILLDVMMPEMDGRDVCKKLKESPETTDIPIIMLTSRDSVHDRSLGVKLGVAEYIEKPCNLAFLIRTIEKISRRM